MRFSGVRPGFAGRRFAFHNRAFFRHHRHFRNRFAFFFGAPFGYYDYAYYDDCYVRVWTRWGWRWRNVCYPYY